MSQLARMVELVDTTDLNSVDPNGSCGFKSRSGYLESPPNIGGLFCALTIQACQGPNRYFRNTSNLSHASCLLRVLHSFRGDRALAFLQIGVVGSPQTSTAEEAAFWASRLDTEIALFDLMQRLGLKP